MASVALVMSWTLGCACSSGDRTLTLEFPADQDLGALQLVEDPNCFTCGSAVKDLGRAKGEVKVRLPAAHWYVNLKMPAATSALMPRLAHPSIAGLGGLDLQGTDVRDEDLRHIAHIDLRYLDLRGTHLTGAGFAHIKPDERWIFVDLRQCVDLDPNSLAHFRGWKRATITLVGGSPDERKTKQEAMLLYAASDIICDGRPESECGTQIR